MAFIESLLAALPVLIASAPMSGEQADGPAGDAVPAGPQPPYTWARLSDETSDWWKCDTCPDGSDVAGMAIDDAVTHARATGHTVRANHLHIQTVTGVMI